MSDTLLLGAPLSEWLQVALVLACAGCFTGFFAGLFGVGGGAVMVPALFEAFGLLGVPQEVRMPLCVGTSLAVIIPTSIRSYRAHQKRGSVDDAVLKLWLWPVVCGVMVGGAIASFAAPDVFKGVFAAISTTLALKLLFGKSGWRLSPDLPGDAIMRLYGFVVGLGASLMGVGGGGMSNIILGLHGKSIHRAVGTSAGLGVIISIPGTIAYAVAGWSKMAELPPLSIGFVSGIGILLMVPATMLVVPLGVRVAHSMSARRLELLFGLFLLAVAARFFASILA